MPSKKQFSYVDRMVKSDMHGVWILFYSFSESFNLFGETILVSLCEEAMVDFRSFQNDKLYIPRGYQSKS